jgi:DNA-binding winged helix-turn-helix (wHTH) protein
MHDVMDSVAGEEALVFGPYELRADGSLRCAGEWIPLTPKEAGVLAVLCGAAGRIVLKNEIVERVWAGYPASDASLARCVHTLRRRLAAVKGCIALVYGRGYRLAVPVERVPLRVVSVARGADSVPEPRSFPREPHPASTPWARAGREHEVMTVRR